jgi:hypothetical protein
MLTLGVSCLASLWQRAGRPIRRSGEQDPEPGPAGSAGPFGGAQYLGAEDFAVLTAIPSSPGSNEAGLQVRGQHSPPLTYDQFSPVTDDFTTNYY